MSSDPDPQRERIIRMLSTLFDFSFGTLWWVRESVWKDGFKTAGQPYQHSNAREAHPGVSIRAHSEIEDLGEAVPMLQGGSKKGAVRVTGFSARNPSRETRFGSIIAPVKVPLADFLYPDDTGNGQELEGRFLDRKKVVANLHKPRLSPDESSCLWKFLEEKQIL